MARCFCCRWARGRMLMSLSSIQLVEPFAASLAWAAIFVMLLNLILIVLLLQTFPPLLLDTFLSSASLFIVKNCCRCVFFHKHAQTGSLKSLTAVAECFPVLCTEHTSLESRRIHMQISTFNNQTYRKSWLIAASVFFSCRKNDFLLRGNSVWPAWWG